MSVLIDQLAEAGGENGRAVCLRIVADVSGRGICSTALSRRSGRTSSRYGDHFLLSEGMHFFSAGFVLLPEVHGLCLLHGHVLYGRGGMSLAGMRQATTSLRLSCWQCGLLHDRAVSELRGLHEN